MATNLRPLEWLTRLSSQIQARWTQLDYWDRYYNGDHDLPAGPAQHLETYRKFQAKARLNLCALPVHSVVDRSRVVGIKDGTPEGAFDDTLFGWWQANRMDARQSTLYRYALRHGDAFLIVGTHPKGQRPRWTIESARSVAVEVDPAEPLARRAAARLWADPVEGVWNATLWLPGVRYTYRTRPAASLLPDGGMVSPPAGADGWIEVRKDRSPEAIPVIPFTNGDELTAGEAEFARGIDTQDRLNLTLLNRLTSERYSAFRQRWAANLDLEEDPVTGKAVQPFVPGSTELWVAGSPDPGSPEVRFGDFAQTDTTQMLAGVTSDIKAYMAETTTPVYYMPGDLTNVGADTIAAIDAGHISKCYLKHATWGEAWEEVLGSSADVMGVSVDLSRAEAQWERPENWHPTQVADLVSKYVTAGVPLPVVMEDIGRSPQYIDRLRTAMAEDEARKLIGGFRPAS